MNKKEALTQLEIMATNATGRLGEIPDENSRQIERGMLKKHIEALDMAMDALKDCKPKTGRWLESRARNIWGMNVSCYECSECGTQAVSNVLIQDLEDLDYCPKCGAKMERSKE